MTVVASGNCDICVNCVSCGSDVGLGRLCRHNLSIMTAKYMTVSIIKHNDSV